MLKCIEGPSQAPPQCIFFTQNLSPLFSLFTHFYYFNMKKSFFKRNFRALVAMFFLLGGLFFATNRAAAQSYNWKSESQAMAQLQSEMDQLSLDIQNFVPGSTQYKNLINHLAYYKLITVSIEEGHTTETAVNESLGHVNDQYSATKDFLSKTVLVGLFNDAVVLLTN